MNIYLVVREDKTVTGAYEAKRKKNSTDILYFKDHVRDKDDTESIEESLSIRDSDGKFNHKYINYCFMQMTNDEKTAANKTEADEALDELQDTDYKIIKAMEQLLENNTDDAELIELISKREAARAKINEAG